MKSILSKVTSIIALTLVSCSTLTPNQSALLTTSSNLAKVAVEAAATYYGGPLGAQLAASGLDAVALVAQSYLGSSVPKEVLQATPGVKGVGSVLVKEIAPNHVVNQSDVNSIQKAADIARTLEVAVTLPKS